MSPEIARPARSFRRGTSRAAGCAAGSRSPPHPLFLRLLALLVIQLVAFVPPRAVAGSTPLGGKVSCIAAHTQRLESNALRVGPALHAVVAAMPSYVPLL